MKKKLITFFTTLVISLLAVSITAFAGTSFNSATNVSLNSSTYCYVSSSSPYQYYRFYADASATYRIYSDSNDFDTYGYLYDSNQVQLASDDDSNTNGNFLIEKSLSPGYYYVMVRAYNTSNSGDCYVHIDKKVAKSISKATVTLSTTSYTYNGSAKKPSPTVKLDGVKLVKDTDYTVKYSNNVNKGTVKVTITGKGNYSGTKTATFKIKAKKVTSCYVKNQGYDGKAKVPAVHYTKTVKEYDSYSGEYYTYKKDATFKKNKDYTISVSGKHKSIGKYTCTIKFKGNYTGTVKKTFKIVPKKVKGVKTSKRKTTSIYATWSKVKGAQGYKVYRYSYKDGKYKHYKTVSKPGLTINRSTGNDEDVSFYIVAYKKVGKTTYKSEEVYGWNYLKPSKATFTIKKTNFGEFTVNFPAYRRYQVQVSTKKNFSNIVCTYRDYASSVRFYNFKSGKKYYVRARKYIYNKSGDLEVGPWSDVKSVTPY